MLIEECPSKYCNLQLHLPSDDGTPALCSSNSSSTCLFNTTARQITDVSSCYTETMQAAHRAQRNDWLSPSPFHVFLELCGLLHMMLTRADLACASLMAIWQLRALQAQLSIQLFEIFTDAGQMPLRGLMKQWPTLYAFYQNVCMTMLVLLPPSRMEYFTSHETMT